MASVVMLAAFQHNMPGKQPQVTTRRQGKYL